MLSWYDRSRLVNESPALYTEAGVKENVFFALLTAVLTGADLAVLNRISDKTGVPIEAIARPASDDIWEQVEDAVARGKNDPKIQALLEQSQQLAAEVKSEMENEKQTSPAAQPRKPSTEWDAIMRAVIAVEGASANYVGPAGDTGVMQLLPTTWEEMNRLYFHGQYPYRKYGKNAQVNMMMGKKYLQHIRNWLEEHREHWKGDPTFLMFACYNGGMGNVQRMGFDPKKIEKHLPRVYDYATRALNLLG